MRTKPTAILGTAILFGMIVSVLGCDQGNQARGPISRYLAKAAAPAPAAEDSAGSAGMPMEAEKSADKGNGTAVMERKLIARVSLTLEVKDLKVQVLKAETIAKEEGGYLSDSQIYQEETSERASLTLMIPFTKLDQAVVKIRELGKVRFEQKSTEDVTRQFIDSQARVNNLQKEEAALSELLKRTGKLSDILEVENELSRVRTEIEQIQGELRYLEHLTSYSTVTLSLETRPEPEQYESSPLKNAFIRAWHSFRATVHGIAVLLIYGVFYLPLLLAGYFILKLIVRKLWKRKKAA